jgi:hypothetical protein
MKAVHTTRSAVVAVLVAEAWRIAEPVDEGDRGRGAAASVIESSR